jgi:aminotransferase in exopolysaccharide biosynthesis
MFEDAFEFICAQFENADFIPLHEPCFGGNEKTYLNDCIDSTYVSSVGAYINRFETATTEFTGSRHAIAVVNGTQGLFVALKAIGVDASCEVLTQSLSFVATANAIHSSGAVPVFLDVDRETLGLSPEALKKFLHHYAEMRNGRPVNKASGRVIAACLPMHTCGHPCRITEIAEICNENRIELIEDAAESLGSFVGPHHSGTIGLTGIFSFNGNKIVTTGGGGMIVTDDDQLAKKLRHLTTTAKVHHQWEYIHDEIGYNFRMPNLNAALGLAQIEQLTSFLESKRQLAGSYRKFFADSEITFLDEPTGCRSNFWLNTILMPDEKQKRDFLEQANRRGIGARSLWRPMHLLDMYQHCQRDNQSNTEDIYRRGINLPSSAKD